MAFKKTRHSHSSAEDPEALYRDYKNRKVEGLLAHQADLLREYQKQALDSSDVALQLPTGSGKTLVGLLLGEWRLRRFNQRVVYLCPTRQLVNQVVEQSQLKYGIKANAFVGKQSEYSPANKAEYTNAETLAVTTYSGLFNTNSFFDNADIIILDDAHAAENYISKYWSILIERDKTEHSVLFQALVSALRDIVSPAHYTRLLSKSPDMGDRQWVEKIPTPHLYSKLSEFTAILDEHIGNSTDLKYPWSVIREHLLSCHIYISVDAILIRPLIPPTRTHKPFSNAKQRIYMSATLGEGGDLERLSGVEKIVRLPVPEGWGRQGIGRRLFFFPERSLDQESSLNLAINMIQVTPRSLVLVTDNHTATDFKDKIPKKAGYKIFDAAQIEQSKQAFVSEEKAVAVVANRYDGIDLVGDECRLLILNGLQRATNLQEKFLVTRMPASILFNDRILTRIVQAVGRCTRSATDYAAVVILGEELNKFLLDKDRRRFLHPELQAELEFGIDQSRDVEQAGFLENLQIFLEHKEEWKQADDDILSQRDKLQQSKLPGTDKLKDAVSHEVRYQYALWNGNFEKAVEECRAVVTSLSGDDVQGYRAFWYYLAGSAAWMAANKGIASMETVARDFFKRAASTTEGVQWLYELSRLKIAEYEENQTDASRLAAVIEELEVQLSALGTVNDRKFEAEVKRILENLSKVTEADSKKFEDGHERLGRLLGYTAANSEADAAPDPWWIAGDDFCIVFEDHSSNSQGTPLGANKVRQVASHPNWIKDNQQLLRNDAEIIPVIVTPCESLASGAVPHTGDVCYWNQKEFQVWAEQAIAVVRSLRSSFPGEADLTWRKQAIQAYRDGGLDPASLAKKLRERRLDSLPAVN
ncbi:MAG: DEAD/DEAH box helicase [Oscillatoria princeps RMCB-10]|jgi:Rad3-related DNA helicase|nr:DEAD/DEAH box helicase [Oscillatoria princeps RMCB-10]